MGIGIRGGRSHDPGSRSRMRISACECPEGTIGRTVRVASYDGDATGNRWKATYQMASA